jgi:drug/metabolite transporter (DMT)-like permease
MPSVILPAIFSRPVPERWRVLAGIALMCTAGAMFPFMNAFAKILGQTYSTLEVSWARFFGHVVFTMMVFLPASGVRMFITRQPGIQFARSAIQCLSNCFFVAAIVFIPLADAAAIGMLGPLIVALLAWPMLGERTSFGHAVAILVGFIGVLIVIRPGSAVFHPSSLFLIGSATCFALYQILTRMGAGVDSTATTTFYSSAFGAVAMLVVLPFVGQFPVSFLDFGMFCMLGILGGAGHYCVVRALAYAPANIIAPFQYFQLLGSVGVGFLMFGQLPDLATWIGAGVVISAGLWLGWSRRRG